MTDDLRADVTAWLDGDEHTEEWDVDWLLRRCVDALAARTREVEAVEAACFEVCRDNTREALGDDVDPDLGRFVCVNEDGDPIIEADTPADVVRQMAACWTALGERYDRLAADLAAARAENDRLRGALQGEGQRSGDGVRVAPERAHGDRVSEDLEPMQATSTAPESLTAAPAPASAPLSDPAPLSGAGNTGETGKPRRWWLVVDCDGTPRKAYEWDERLLADRRAAELNHTGDPYAPFAVVPVVEARVTRETVERVEGIVRKARGTNRTSEHWAYEIVRALGLTVEE